MKERVKGAFTKKKIFHFLKMALFVVALSLILLSLLGTVAHATGLVDDTINAENLYSKYPLSNYQLDFYVDNSWSWLPWNWLDGIGKSVQYGLYCITNFVWTISLYLSNADVLHNGAVHGLGGFDRALVLLAVTVTLVLLSLLGTVAHEIGRASCRERVSSPV